MPIGNDWLALQGWHTAFPDFQPESREGHVQERCHKQEIMLKRAADLLSPNEGPGAQPTSLESIRPQELLD